jgi:hypothetical protein
MWLEAETNRDPKQKPSPFLASDFHPYERGKARPKPRLAENVKMRDIKGLLMGTPTERPVASAGARPRPGEATAGRDGAGKGNVRVVSAQKIRVVAARGARVEAAHSVSRQGPGREQGEPLG